MTLPATEQLAQLSHADLLALVTALIAENAALRNEVSSLRAEVEKLRLPPPGSRNSAQPPSRDQKGNLPQRRSHQRDDGAARGLWLSDCFSVQLKAPAQAFQLCLAHQLRDLERVRQQHPKQRWAGRVQELLREAIHLKHRFARARPELTLRGYLRRVAELENRLDRLLGKKLPSAAARRLQARYQLHRDQLLTFLYYPGVPPTNNDSEQALRRAVIHRKPTASAPTSGAEADAALQSVIATARRKGEQVFDVLVNLMGAPVLHFLDASSP